MIKPNIGL